MKHRRFLALVGVAALALAACSGGGAGTPAPSLPTSVGDSEGTLSVLAWPGYAENGSTDPAVDWITPFEEETGCKTTVQVFGTSDEAFSLFTTNPEKFDGTIEEMVGDLASRMGENISVKRFARVAIGE